MRSVIIGHRLLNLRRSRRGVALMLAMIAIIVAGTVAYSYVGSQNTAIALAGNIKNHGQARYLAETGLDIALAAIRTNSTWRTQRPNGAWITDQAFGAGTYTIVGQDGVDTNGDGVVDGDGSLSDDPTDLLTLTITGKVSGSSHILRAVVTPVANELIVYGRNGSNTPYYRTWSETSWSSAQTANTIGSNPAWIVAAMCPARHETAMGALGSDLHLNVEFYTGTSWSSASQLTASTSQNAQRPFDIAYEQSSGDLLMAYRTSADSNLHYRTYSGSSVSSESSYTLPSVDALDWVRLFPKTASDEILLMTEDASKNICAVIWNGSSWSSGVTLETNNASVSGEGIAAAYEGLSGDGLVIWTVNGKHLFSYRTRSGSSWSSASDGPTLGGKESLWLRLVADPASDKIIAASLDGNNDIYVVVWNGSSWGTPLAVETNAPDATSRQFDIAFQKQGSSALAVWGRSAVNNFFYRTWNGSSWSSEQTGPGLADKVAFAQTVTGSANSQIFVTIQNKQSPGQLESFLWDGSSFSSLTTVESTLSGSSTQEVFMLSAAPSSGTAGYTYAVDWRQ